jgi:hypothetical protein
MNKRLTGMVSVLIATVAALTALPTAGARAACAVAPVAAHRGNWDGTYDDNTRNGFRYTQNHDARAWWETDVNVADDGRLVMQHDATASWTLTLWDFLNDVSVDKPKVFMELKFVPTNDQWTQLIEMIDAYGVRPNIILTSFVGQTLLTAEQKAPNIQRGLIESAGYTSASNITKYHVQYYLKHSDSITAARMTEWTGAGLKVAPWSDHLSNSPDEWKRMNYYPMVTIITDTGAAYDTWASQQGCTVTKK